MKYAYTILFMIACALTIYQCTTIQGQNNEKKKNILSFLEQFEKNLKDSDSIIMGQFHTDKSQEVIMKSIRIMQNVAKEKDSIECLVNFKSAEISFEDNEMRVTVPVKYNSLDGSVELSNEAESKFTLWLEPDNDELIIKKIDADGFYNDYQRLVHELSYKKLMAKELASGKIFFEQAKKLQEKYDSVVWYTRYYDSTYYYVVNGKWENYFIRDRKRPDSCRMGLVSETGRVVVPAEYDLVGTIAFEMHGMIEVKKKGQVGLFHISGKEIVPALYDWVIPYSSGDVTALVKQDSVFGWLDLAYAYHTGFPSRESENYINKFEYLSKPVSIDAKSKVMTKVLHADQLGWGMVMPPAYLVNAGIVKEIVSDINTGDSVMGWGGTGYIKTEGSFFEQLTGKLFALVVTMKEQYVEGRQEFYKRNNITFLDTNNKPIGSFNLGAGSIRFKKIDSTLIEVKGVYSVEDLGFSQVGNTREWNLHYFDYFRISKEKGIEKVASKRRYNFTQLVKIDSSYLYGNFAYWDKASGSMNTRSRLSDETLEEIRNEILAYYGYAFDDPKTTAHFKYQDWYKPRYSYYEDFLDKMTPVDRYNLEFLETFIPTLRKPAS